MPYKSKKQNREYQRKWRMANRAKQTERNKVNRQKTKTFVASLKNKPCVDCGKEYPPYVMDFDHRKDKVIGIASAINYGWGQARILKEVKKCDLVCANCHRLRTFRRIVQQKNGTLIQS